MPVSFDVRPHRQQHRSSQTANNSHGNWLRINSYFTKKDRILKLFLAVFSSASSALFTFGTSPESKPHRRPREGVAAWRKWASESAATIVEMGGPFGITKLITDRVSVATDFKMVWELS